MTDSDKGKSSRQGDDARRAEPFLGALGQRVRAARAQRGISRKILAQTAAVSERHLANLESGNGNVSVLVLQQVAAALDCELAELIGDFTTASSEWLMIRSMLANCDEAELHAVRLAIDDIISNPVDPATPPSRIALIGLRGAGKSTLGRRLAKQLELPFIELSREIETLAACSIGEIRDLYGASAYRRYEHQALQQALRSHPAAVIATPGGLVSDAASFKLLLSSCACIWLEATPADHMRRVIEQGDFRPMSGSDEAMQDLKGILSAREPFYARAGQRLNTSAQSLDASFERLCELAQAALRR